MERGPGGEVLLLALLLLVACGGTDGGASSTDAAPDASVVTDTSADAPDSVPDTAATDVATTFHAMADPATPGTYTLKTDAIELTVNVSDGLLFVLRAKVGCAGVTATPCVYERSVPALTCSTSYEKGYTAPLVDNHGVAAIKEDTLELWATAPGKLEGVYHLTPGKCCEAHPVVALSSTDASPCEGYETPDCDPYAATGCADGQHCVFDDAGRPGCVPDGPTALGGACDGGAAACADGACINLGGTGSRCYAYCTSGGAQCGGLACLSLTGSTYKVCQLPASAFEPCDLLAPACAKGGEACYLSGITTEPICQVAGDDAVGADCKDDNQCAPGLLCITQVCRTLCRVGGGEPACADAFQTCKNPFGAGVPWGVCVTL